MSTTADNTGYFITLEGIEGVGKSTQLEFVVSHLRARGHRVLATREPGGTAVGERIRALLLDRERSDMAPTTELLLIFAARAQHLAQVIESALATGTVVVSDRFTDATFAYQGGGRGIDAGRIAALETFVQGGRRPDLSLLLDAPIALAMARRANPERPDRFEAEAVEFFERVQRAYREIAARDPERVKLIDASKPLPAVQSAIVAALAEALP